jgi:uncharacterized membrane protein
MDSRVDRRLLGAAGRKQALTQTAMDAALTLSGLRPDRAEWRQFAVRSLQSAGVLSLAFGVIFLVAFNWKQLGLYGRFALVEIPMLLAVAFVWIRGLEGLTGKLALLLAVLLTGALLALFGETYQTGADVFELFLGWAVLALPWVAACRFSPCWGLWLLLINLAAVFYSGWSDHLNLIDSIFSPKFGLTAWALPFLINALAFIAVEALSRSRVPGFEARWLGRALMTAAMSFASANVVIVVVDLWRSNSPKLFAPLLFIVCSAGLFVYAFWRKDDLFPFAVLALSWLVVTTTVLGRAMGEASVGIGGVLVVAIYIVAAAAGAAKGIAYVSDLWKVEQAHE